MTVKCDPCDGGSIDCAHCEHRPLPKLIPLQARVEGPTRKFAPASPLDTQVGGDHYKRFKIQPAHFAAVNGLSFFEGNVVKYTVRRKGDKAKRLEDLAKAIDCLEKLRHYVEQDLCS